MSDKDEPVWYDFNDWYGGRRRHIQQAPWRRGKMLISDVYKPGYRRAKVETAKQAVKEADKIIDKMMED